jgi:hypothetical protein
MSNENLMVAYENTYSHYTKGCVTYHFNQNRDHLEPDRIYTSASIALVDERLVIKNTTGGELMFAKCGDAFLESIPPNLSKSKKVQIASPLSRGPYRDTARYKFWSAISDVCIIQLPDGSGMMRCMREIEWRWEWYKFVTCMGLDKKVSNLRGSKTASQRLYFEISEKTLMEIKEAGYPVAKAT